MSNIISAFPLPWITLSSNNLYTSSKTLVTSVVYYIYISGNQYLVEYSHGREF
jgi:hypothetical protein